MRLSFHPAADKRASVKDRRREPSLNAGRRTTAATALSTPAMPPSSPFPLRRSRVKRRRGIAYRWRYFAIALSMLLAGGGVIALRDGQGGFGAGELIAQVSAAIGLRIEDVLVSGRERVSTQTLLETLQIRYGSSILAFDAEAARTRLEQLPWIEKVIVERRLPNILYIEVEEKHPLALWQHERKFSVIDAKGMTILEDDAGRFSYLPVIIGDDAPAQAEALLMMLATEPDLHKRVAAATRVGGRRWNLHLDNGIDVRLPEDDPAVAWSALADMARMQGLLNRDVIAIDLRAPDRMIVQLPKESADRAMRTTLPKRNG